MCNGDTRFNGYFMNSLSHTNGAKRPQSSAIKYIMFYLRYFTPVCVRGIGNDSYK